MSKLEEELREIEELIFKSKSLTAKLAKKVESHPLVGYFEEIEFSRRGVYFLHFKPLAPWLRELDILVGSYATPGWESEFKTGIFLEPDLYSNSKEFDLYFPGDGKGSYSRDNVRIGSDTVNVREYLEFFLPEKTEKMYDELFLVPVKEKKLESIKNVDDYIDWYYGQIDRVIETLKKSFKLVKEVAIDNPMFNKGGELMDADTEFEYKRGGNIDKTDPEYIEYSRLSEKLSAGTITPKEKERLFILAFGEDYMKSKNKGKKRKYTKSGKRVKDRDRDEYAKGGDVRFVQKRRYVVEWREDDGLNSEYFDSNELDIAKDFYNQIEMDKFYYEKPQMMLYDFADRKVLMGDDNFAKGGNVNNKVDTISNWVMFCYNYPSNFMDAFGEKDNPMRKHLTTKFESFYDRVGPGEVMNKFYVNLDNKNRTKLVDWFNQNYKGQ